MIVGFTGTRAGMTADQEDQLALVLHCFYNPGGTNELHHGDEEHSDRRAAAIAAEIGYAPVPHQPTEHTAKALLGRDVEIVSAVHVLIAAPRTDREEIRSGTWYTVRRAREKAIPVDMLSRGGELLKKRSDR